MAEQRLIDANNLIEEIREERCYNCRNFKDMKCDYCGTADYIYMIEDMPAVEAKPVVHGRWIPLTECANEGVYCSICKKKVWKSDYAQCSKKSRNKLESNYCPNCGAKMDEKENDDGC